MAQQRRSADVIVIGGGLHGCATALYLALAGLKSIVVEKDVVGRHASTANAGGVRRLGRHLAEIPLALAALDIWQHIQDLVDDDCGFVPSCQVKVAASQDDLLALSERRKFLLHHGYQHEELIDRRQLLELIPSIAAHCVGAIVVDGDGYANPFLTMQAFKRRAIAAGVRIQENTAVSALDRHAGIWQLNTSHGVFEAPIVVNCAGAWGGRIAAMLGEPVPIQAQALMLMITARVKPFINPVLGAQGQKLSFKQFANGSVLIGGGYQGRADPKTNRTELDFKGLAASAATAAQLFPGLRGVQIIRSWAGIEGVLEDGIPVIGASANDGAFHAFGFCGHGFALSPIVGKIITDLIVHEQSPLPIEAFSIGRFIGSSCANG